ncbi:MAG TPA: hypothetical protein VHS34_13180, partial [Terriglobales bacterium]|nr:hypothetical protein [Terriglobales bacterium]
MVLVCDNNLSGTTIASGGNCPSNNVVCSLPSTLNPPVGNDTFARSGLLDRLLRIKRANQLKRYG